MAPQQALLAQLLLRLFSWLDALNDSYTLAVLFALGVGEFAFVAGFVALFFRFRSRAGQPAEQGKINVAWHCRQASAAEQACVIHSQESVALLFVRQIEAVRPGHGKTGFRHPEAGKIVHPLLEVRRLHCAQIARNVLSIQIFPLTEKARPSLLSVVKDKIPASL